MSTASFDLSGTVAVVTGASRGLGQYFGRDGSRRRNGAMYEDASWVASLNERIPLGRPGQSSADNFSVSIRYAKSGSNVIDLNGRSSRRDNRSKIEGSVDRPAGEVVVILRSSYSGRTSWWLEG